jgi:hypothetical protein
MKGIGERTIIKSPEGDLRLQPSASAYVSNYGMGSAFFLLGLFFVVRGVSLLREGGIGGVIPAVFGLLLSVASIAITQQRLRKIAAIHIESGKRTIKFAVIEKADCKYPGNTALLKGRIVPFEEVSAVVVRAESESPYAMSSVRLVLGDNESEIVLNKEMPFWKATCLAEHTAGILECRACVKSPSEFELTPSKPDMPWAPRAPRIPGIVKVLRVWACSFIALGFGSFMACFVIAIWGGEIFAEIELPLGAPSGVAVDLTERVFVGSRAYRRVQRYNADGQFERGWHVPGGKGEWHMFIDEKNRLRLAVGGFYYQMNDKEQLVQIRGQPQEFFRQRQSVPREAAYHLQRFPLRVVRRDDGTTDRTVVRQGFLMTILTAPFPAWAIGVFGLIMAIAVNAGQKRTRGKKGAQQETGEDKTGSPMTAV